MEHKAYLHRSGRTARAGCRGRRRHARAADPGEGLALLMRKAGIQAATQRVTPTSDAVVALIGDRAEYVKPVPRAVATQSGGGRSQGANAQRKRAARVGGADAQPRADRSGRPARSAAARDRPRDRDARRAQDRVPRHPPAAARRATTAPRPAAAPRRATARRRPATRAAAVVARRASPGRFRSGCDGCPPSQNRSMRRPRGWIPGPSVCSPRDRGGGAQRCRQPCGGGPQGPQPSPWRIP